ncbi:MAG: hypothetical protein CL672_03695 [Balneola sp.]|nr:hypothetical protein [Balneola sp.]
MRQLVAESGSTKTLWSLLEGNRLIWSGRTLGMNPYFVDLKKLCEILWSLRNDLPDNSFEQIYFYGSGCSNEAMKNLILEAFSTVFPNFKTEVDTDLMAAARALFGSNCGIVAILGTGSSCGLFNGEYFSDYVPSLGFSLGDEGSAGYFGKYIVRDYYYKILPAEISSYIEKHFDMDIDNTLNRLYKEGQGNTYIASFASVLAEFSTHIYSKHLIEEGIKSFVKLQLKYFDNIELKKIGIVGTVAAIHQKTINNILSREGWELIKVIKEPMDLLITYHMQTR